ncbi:hypothetical protein Goshw_014278, partial [Gossypium schwendimanii]|nr:hypothetical protein [Gossypium schwendimanii]
MRLHTLLFSSLFLSYAVVLATAVQCGEGAGGGALGDIVSSELFEEMLPHRNDPYCPAANFYTYDAFIAAAKLYPDFAATGDNDTRKREVAAFLGQTSHVTT